MPSLRTMANSKPSKGRSALWRGSMNGRHSESKAMVGSKASWESASRKPSGNIAMSLSKAIRSGKAAGGGAAAAAAAGSHERVSQWLQQVSALQMQEMEEAFTFFDENKDGKITQAELAAALRRLGEEDPTEEEVAAMMKEADTNGDGVISFEEFLTLQSGVGSLHRQDGGAVFLQDLRLAFDRFDANRDGLISPKELQCVMNRLGGGRRRPCSVDDCLRMIARVDLNGDGQIDFDEFLSMMRE